MRSRAVASLLALCLVTSNASALEESHALSIEYPIAHYRLGPDPPDKARRARDVSALGTRLTTMVEVQLSSAPSDDGSASVVSGLPLGRTIPPIRILWNDPRFLLREAVIVEWIELVDEQGRASHVWITASNQPPAVDEKIVRWCSHEAPWRAGVAERSAPILRTAGVTLVGSRYHYSTWLGALRTKKGLAAAFAALAIAFWLIARVVNFRHERKMRHEQMMARLHKASPYKPRSIDDDV